MRKYRNYSDDDIKKFSLEVTSLSQLLEKLNLRKAGGNFANMKRNLQRLGIDTSHWTGTSWNAGQRLKDWSRYSRATNLKKHLIKDRGNICQACSLETWLGFKIKLEIHHVDGNRTNNQESNLKLLCPNCHSLTKSWRVPNHSHKELH